LIDTAGTDLWETEDLDENVSKGNPGEADIVKVEIMNT
jgi:hypothetical protein